MQPDHPHPLAGAVKPGEIERAIEALEWTERQRQDALLRAEAISAPEDAAVRALCEAHGYGAVMDSASRQWVKKAGSGAFFIGGCVGDTSFADALLALSALSAPTPPADVAGLVERLAGVEITAVRANRTLMGTSPVTQANADAQEAAAAITALSARVAELEAALADARDKALEEAAERVREGSEKARGKLSACYHEGHPEGASVWSAIVAHLDIAHEAIRAMKSKP